MKFKKIVTLLVTILFMSFLLASAGAYERGGADVQSMNRWSAETDDTSMVEICDAGCSAEERCGNIVGDAINFVGETIDGTMNAATDMIGGTLNFAGETVDGTLNAAGEVLESDCPDMCPTDCPKACPKACPTCPTNACEKDEGLVYHLLMPVRYAYAAVSGLFGSACP